MEASSPSTTLAREECLQRLSLAPLVRILVSVKCLPTALPTRIHVLNAQRILFASDDPSIIHAAQRHDVLTVQVDGIDGDDHPWSVVASGVAEIDEGSEPMDDILGDASGYGGQLISLPLSVVVGQRY